MTAITELTLIDKVRKVRIKLEQEIIQSTYERLVKLIEKLYKARHHLTNQNLVLILLFKKIQNISQNILY